MLEYKPWLKNYDEGVPNEIKIPDISLVDLFKTAVKERGALTCIIFEDKTFSYRMVDDLSDRIARFLISAGLKVGDRVGILLPNIPEFVISYYGILKAGGVVMAINPAFRPIEIENQSVESGINILIFLDRDYNRLKPLIDKMQFRVVVVESKANHKLEYSEEPIFWNQVLGDFSEEKPIRVEVRPDDPAVFQFSGGTTGTPKCAIGLHRNLVANTYQFDSWLANAELGKETVLVAIPIYHVYGMVLGMNLAVKMQARMVLIPDPRNLDELLFAAEKHQATIFPGVPSLYASINHYPSVISGKYDLSSIKACISGSATLPTKVKQDFETLTHGHLVEGYGLSEAPTATHCNPILGENREGSIGLPLPNVDCKVVDLETGMIEVDPGEIGELVIKGPQVMFGYYNQKEETKLALRDGWLFTGDVVKMDKDGYFYIVDRKKDVIKVGGFQVWPNEIEAVIMGCPQVKEVAVAGISDINGTEVVKAWVVLNQGEKLTAEEIKSYCNQYLARYKIPRYYEFRDSLPRTSVGKVLRRVLSEEHKF